MHIPDGYLGPKTYGTLFLVMIPFWALALRKLRQTLHARQAPYLALGAAFTFVIMMFNIPVPGGTTGHAIGSTLVAILAGPWAAVISVSVALIIQALLFGDGGITSIGANCFNMAMAGVFVGYGVYRLVAGSSEATGKRRLVAAGIGAYVSLNVSALLAGIQFGLQPLLERTADGQPLYSPFPLEIAVPAMAIQHILFFGFIEAAVTVLVIRYLQKHDPSLLAGPGEMR